MNGIPASIVIRHLMAGPSPTTPSQQPARTARPVGRSASRRVVMQLTVATVLVAAVLGFVLVLTVRTGGAA